MRQSHTFRTALAALRRNIMRAALTTLGIVIGIAAVITMVEIGSGSSAAIQRTMESMGANTILVFPGMAATGGVSFGAGSRTTLTPYDCDAIIRDCPGVETAAPVVRVRAQLVYGNRNYVPMNIYGTTPSFLPIRNWANLAQGECFTDRDVRNAGKVCVIGQTIVRQLFDAESPIGKEVRIRNVSFHVVGVLEKKGGNMMGWDQDDVVLAPWTSIKYRVAASSAGMVNQSSSSSVSSGVNTLSQTYPSTGPVLFPQPSETQQADTPLPVRFANVDQIMASAKPGEPLSEVVDQVTQLLRQRHRIGPAEESDFQVRDMTEITRALTSTTSLMSKLLLCVAFISLVVGGVGIMNIMLVSVTERTREIGLRMAVGARARDILRQFLTEAVLLCFMGGVTGIVLGRLSSYLVSTFLKWPTKASLWAAIAAVAVSVTVGIVFGFYPAWKAAKLDPIHALRYE